MDRIGLICRYIKEDPRSTQRDLAQKTGFSVGTVNTLIKEAMQKRLIAQGKSVAGTYELTGAGDDFLEQFKVDGALIIAAGFGSRFVPFILLLITPIFNWMKGTKVFKPLVTKLETKAMSKSDKIEKYEFWGLVLFVGIPLPGTGAWTGSLIAALLGIKFKKAFPAVVIGICMATVIMWFVSYVLLGSRLMVRL